MDVEVVGQALHRLYIAAEGTILRKEDRKKAVEMAGLLDELARIHSTKTTKPTKKGKQQPLVVDAAAGKAYAGFLAAELCGVRRLVIIERDPARLESCRLAARALPAGTSVTLRAGDVADATLWPHEPDIVMALHACGAASDAIIDASIAVAARWLLIVPCCYPNPAAFVARADALGLPWHAEVRRRFVMSHVDAERALRLEAAGYETKVVPFVAPTVTPHNLLYRARRVGEKSRMRVAAERLARLHAVPRFPPG